MKLPTNWDGEYIVAGSELANERPLCEYPGSMYDTIWVASVADTGEPTVGQLRTLEGHEVSRYLDRFHVVTPQSSPERKQEIMNDFFQMIAERYESLIDIDRNLDNIRNIAHILDQHMSPLAGRVVDFGCGTGLAAQVLAPYDVHLIGVDPCPTMRALARSRGMDTLSIGQLAIQPEGSVDAAFASYVFHLQPHGSSLKFLWSRISPGGYLVGNFHKGRGVEFVEASIGVDGHVIGLPPGGDERHGPYLSFLRDR